MELPATRYLDRDGRLLGYYVVGAGPVDLVWLFEIVMHPDLCWSDPHIHHVMERGTSFCRVAYFQRRGFGVSEPVDYVPTMEQQADDVLAVMDAAGMRRATLVGIKGTCGPAALVAARAPERVNGLVLINPLAQGPDSSGSELHGWTAAEATRFAADYRAAYARWGTGDRLALWDSVMGSSAFNRQLGALLERNSTTPAAAQAYLEWYLHLDITDVLRSVQTPTHVLRVPTNSAPEAAVRYAAELIPGATYQVLPPTQLGASIGEAFVPISDIVEEVATGAARAPDADRVFGTVLFTDVVASTELLAEIGDAAYAELRAAHERHVRLAVEEAAGRLVDVAGDGTFSVFEGPTRAVRCAQTIRSEASKLELAVRAGVHTGEIDASGTKISGLTVHIGARVGAAAGAGEVLVSRTVRDLVAGSGLTLTSRGEHVLKGVSGAWELYAVEDDDSRVHVPHQPLKRTAIDRVAMGAARRTPRLVRAALETANAFQRRRAR